MSNENIDSKVIFPEYFGFCGGVTNADDILEITAVTAADYDIPVYGFHEIVHNQDVVKHHEENGVNFVNNISDIADKSIVVISAHGAGPEVFDALSSKGCEIIDATCPLVEYTQKGVETARKNGEKVIYICHGTPGVDKKLNDEIIGIVGCLDYKIDENDKLINDPIERSYLDIKNMNNEPDINDILSDNKKYRIINQTTLNSDDCLEYREKIKQFILSVQPDAIVNWPKTGNVCKAVRNRQDGVNKLVSIKPDRIVVATDPDSSNGKGYVKLAEELSTKYGYNINVYSIANANEAKELPKIEGLTGMTASASTPKKVIEEISEILGEPNPPTSTQEFKIDSEKITQRIIMIISSFAIKLSMEEQND